MKRMNRSCAWSASRASATAAPPTTTPPRMKMSCRCVRDERRRRRLVGIRIRRDLAQERHQVQANGLLAGGIIYNPDAPPPMLSRLSRQTTFSGELPGVLVPNSGRTKQRNPDKAPQIQIAALIQPELRLIRVAVARVSDLANPGAISTWLFVRDDGQSTLRAPVHIGRHRLRRRSIDAHDPPAECIAALRDCDDPVPIFGRPCA